MDGPGYFVPAQNAGATLVEKKSEFIAHLAAVATEEEALAFLAGIRAQHRTASHNVYAYVLRKDARARFSDDGEPAKTAGLPVLAAIQHAGLFNCIIVVTRYYGGANLGTGGLVRAYGGVASQAIEAAGRATIRPVCRLDLTLPYPAYEPALRLLAESGARQAAEPVFAEDVRLAWLIPTEDAPPLAQSLTELLRGGQGLVQSDPFDQSW